MSAKLGVFIVHGMGSQRPDFADELIDDLRRRVDGAGGVSSDIAFESGWWADVLDAAENRLWESMQAARLDYATIRKFVVSALGDAVAYQRVARPAGLDTYSAIHGRIHARLSALRAALGGDKPLIVLAHSLGAVIMSNYIWDRQAAARAARAAGAIPAATAAVPGGAAVAGAPADPLAASDFEAMKTLAGFITYGTTLPLFTLAYAPQDVQAIEFPPAGLAAYFPGVPAGQLRDAARWTNYYDADDVLGYPLKTISPTYARAVSQDVQIDVGMWPMSMTPAAHTAYDADGSFLKPVATAIARVLALCP